MARMKELAEEVKMVYLVVATVVYMMVERVVKLWSLMGSWWRNEEEEDGGGGVVVVVVVRMKKEMEGRMMVEFGVKMVEK